MFILTPRNNHLIDNKIPHTERLEVKSFMNVSKIIKYSCMVLVVYNPNNIYKIYNLQDQ